MSQPLVSIKNLSVAVTDAAGTRPLLNRIDLEIPALSITALVGGSGSGKTTTGLAMLRLLPRALSVTSGEILFEGADLLTASGPRMREIRGGGMSMVFQEPLDAFNPVFSVGYQIDEVLKAHTDMDQARRKRRIWELLDLAGLPEPKITAAAYPHQLSGGMRQRAMIAQAIAGRPKLIIADEPTSNLDVTLQARIMELFRKLKDEMSLSILLITHDLGMVGHMADTIAVMTGGEIVERGATQEVLRNPRHEYTRELMEALML